MVEIGYMVFLVIVFFSSSGKGFVISTIRIYKRIDCVL